MPGLGSQAAAGASVGWRFDAGARGGPLMESRPFLLAAQRLAKGPVEWPGNGSGYNSGQNSGGNSGHNSGDNSGHNSGENCGHNCGGKNPRVGLWFWTSV